LFYGTIRQRNARSAASDKEINSMANHPRKALPAWRLFAAFALIPSTAAVAASAVAAYPKTDPHHRAESAWRRD
jgi:hypothetical protein